MTQESGCGKSLGKSLGVCKGFEKLSDELTDDNIHINALSTETDRGMDWRWVAWGQPTETRKDWSISHTPMLTGADNVLVWAESYKKKGIEHSFSFVICLFLSFHSRSMTSSM